MITDNIKSKVEQAKEKKSQTDKELASQYREAIVLLMKKFVAQVASGDIVIRDATDMQKFIDVYQTLAENDGSENGVPQINSGKTGIIENAININKRTKTDADGNTEVETSINSNDIGKLTPEQMASLYSGLTKEQNNENSGGIV